MALLDKFELVNVLSAVGKMYFKHCVEYFEKENCVIDFTLAPERKENGKTLRQRRKHHHSEVEEGFGMAG